MFLVNITGFMERREERQGRCVLNGLNGVKLIEQQASSLVASRAHQSYSTLMGGMGYGPF